MLLKPLWLGLAHVDNHFVSSEVYLSGLVYHSERDSSHLSAMTEYPVEFNCDLQVIMLEINFQ